jgi:hypothetical protein
MRRWAFCLVLLSWLALSACTNSGGLNLGSSHHSGSGGIGRSGGGHSLIPSVSLPSFGGSHHGSSAISLPSVRPATPRRSANPSPPITLPDLDLPNLTGGLHLGSTLHASGSLARPATGSVTAASGHRHLMAVGAMPRPHWHNPVDGLFAGGSALQSLTVGLASALVTGVTALTTAMLTIGLTLTLLPIVLVFALSGGLLAGVFGLVGILFSLLGFVLWLFLRDILIMFAIAVVSLLALVLGAAALLIGVALLALVAARSARKRRVALA